MLYLASPYSDPNPVVREDRFKIVCTVAGKMLQAGHMIFSPIAHSHPIALLGNAPTAWAFWEQYDKHMLGHSAALWVLTLPGWEESVGVSAEIRAAKYMKIPIVYIDVKDWLDADVPAA